MSDVFKALADPTRREILLMLTEEGANSINKISESFDMSRPAIAKHIKILQSANLIGIELDKSDGRQRNCYVHLEALKEVEEYIAKLEMYWQSKLKGLGVYLKKNKES